MPPRSARRRTPSLVTALVWFGSSYGGALLGYLGVNAIASRIVHDDFGYFVIATSASMVVGQLGLFGAHRGGLREAARIDAADDDGLRQLRTAARVVSWVTLPLTSLAGAVVTYVLLAVNGADDRWTVSALVAVLIWFSGQQKLWANYLRGFGRVRFAGLLEGRSGGALVALTQAAALAVVLAWFADAGLPEALGAMAVGFGVPVLVAWWTLARTWRHVAAVKVDWRGTTSVLSRHRHFAQNMLAGSLNAHLELWLAGLLLSGMDTSLYGSANRIAMLIPVFIMSLGVVFSPLVSRLYGHDDVTLQRLLRTGATLAALLTAGLWLPMLVAPSLILETVFGTTFGEAAPILVILTFGAMSNVLTGMCSVLLTMSEHEAVAARAQWIALGPRLLLGVILGLSLGAAGLAASATTVTVVMWVSLAYLSRRYTGIQALPTLRPEPRLLRQVSA